MDGPYKTANSPSRCWQIKVLVAEHLDDGLEDFVEGVTVQRREDGTTSVFGELRDTAEVYGLILRLRDGVQDLLLLEVHRKPNLVQ